MERFRHAPSGGFLGGFSKAETLQPGMRIDRYGREGGRYVAPEGTPLAERALPPGARTDVYTSYEVVKPLPVRGGITGSVLRSTGPWRSVRASCVRRNLGQAWHPEPCPMSALNREDLRALLASERVDPDAYSLSGGLREDRYCLEQLPSGRWATYFAERGMRSDEREFDSEAAACEALAARILADPTTRLGA